MKNFVGEDGGLIMEKIRIEGMTCQHCVMSITKALATIGLKEIKINLEKGEATFENPGQVSKESISGAVEKAGYKVVG